MTKSTNTIRPEAKHRQNSTLTDEELRKLKELQAWAREEGQAYPTASGRVGAAIQHFHAAEVERRAKAGLVKATEPKKARKGSRGHER